MRYEHRALSVPLEVAAGAAFRVDDLRDLVVQVSGTFDATLRIEGQATAGGAWLPLGDPITDPGWYPVDQPLQAVRMATTVYGSGAPVAVLAGRNHRGE